MSTFMESEADAVLGSGEADGGDLVDGAFGVSVSAGRPAVAPETHSAPQRVRTLGPRSPVPRPVSQVFSSTHGRWTVMAPRSTIALVGAAPHSSPDEAQAAVLADEGTCRKQARLL